MQRLSLWLWALGIGAVNAVVFRVFELLVNNGDNAIWNTWLHSNERRWVVVPLAVGLSVVFSLVLRLVHQKRYVSPDTNLLSELDTGPASLVTIGVILLVGLVSLLAGASLGPEAPLMASAAAIGTWVAGTGTFGKRKQLIILVSVGSLLVAFLGSMIMVLVPLLVMYKKQKRLEFEQIAVTLLAGLAAFGTLHLIDSRQPGYGSVPPLAPLAAHDFLPALIVGFAATAAALLLAQLIKTSAGLAKHTDAHLPWPVSAALFGLVIGAAYLLGGQSIEFSGSAGSKMLISSSVHYGVAALLGLVVTKIIATGWSKASGYRGGLIFPSIYMGLAIGLLVDHLLSGWGGAGAIVGGIAGMMSLVSGSPFIVIIIMAAVLPVKLLGLALLGVFGTTLGTKLFQHFFAVPSKA